MTFKTSYTISKLKSILSENGVQIPTDKDRNKQFYVDLYYELLVEKTIARLQHLSTEDLASYLKSSNLDLPLQNGLLDRELCLQRYARHLVNQNSATLETISVPIPKKIEVVDFTLPSASKNSPVYYTPPASSPVPPTWDPFVPPPPSPTSSTLSFDAEDFDSSSQTDTIAPSTASSPFESTSQPSTPSSPMSSSPLTSQALKPIKFEDRNFHLAWVLIVIEVLLVLLIALYLHDPRAFNDHLQPIARFFARPHEEDQLY
eukprot:TRINITY_DN205_c0_g2_i2.p1 TRINITY_DN205_c0_g2~~TRINITY_DN205_c0_g2_i2.p1  ORF type:complete len:260 (-),score=43.12 TRINITY_DN205_c0_g2_i2:66-845(-)